MNNKRRSRIDKAVSHLEPLLDIIRDILSEEQDAYDNLPENLQDSEKGSVMEDCIQSLEDALDSIEEAVSYLEEAKG